MIMKLGYRMHFMIKCDEMKKKKGARLIGESLGQKASDNMCLKGIE